MNIKDAIITYLKTKTLLTDIIGTSDDARIYSGTGPQDIDIANGSYIVFQVTESDHPQHQGGACAYATYTMLFTIYAVSVVERSDLREALRNLLHTKRNLIVSTVNIRSITLLSCADSYYDSPDGQETGAFAQDMTFDVTFFETVPTLP